MSNPKKQRKRTESFWRRMRFKFKIAFINEGTLEEVWTLRLSRLSILLSVATFATILIGGTALLIILTPIRNYLPGYLNVEIRKEIVQNVLRVDSLERSLKIHKLYLDNIKNIFTDQNLLDSIQTIDSTALINPDFNIPKGEEETKFVKEYKEEEKYNLSALNINPVAKEKVYFYVPVYGAVTAKFDISKHHYGVDIATAEDASVMATLDGTVTYTGYDKQWGNIIIIQHRNGFISVYKHNESLLKKDGDKVTAGQAIALAGNEGKLSLGFHLHFELWYKGIPVNPQEYIAF